jgi:hypothetical protein
MLEQNSSDVDTTSSLSIAAAATSSAPEKLPSKEFYIKIILSSCANQGGAYSFVEMADACSPLHSEFSPVEPESQQESLGRTLMEDSAGGIQVGILLPVTSLPP